MNMLNKSSKSLLALAAFGLVFSGAAKAGDTEFSGFAAPTFTWSNKAAGNTGFHVKDGAIYINHKEGKAKVVVDIPFSFNSTTAGTFNFGRDKAQAYVHITYDSGMNWRLGQWDRLNGFEGVDAKDIPFTLSGILTTAFSAAKSGATVGYDGGSWALDILFNHPNGATNHSVTNNYEFGLHSDWLKGQSFELGLGVIGYNSVYTIDAMLSFGLGNLDLDLEAVFQTGGSSTGLGLLVQALTDFNDSTSGGIRFEYGNKLATVGTATAANSTQIQATIGPQFKVSKAMKLKVDYSLVSNTATGGSAVTSHKAGLGAVYSF